MRIVLHKNHRMVRILKAVPLSISPFLLTPTRIGMAMDYVIIEWK